MIGILVSFWDGNLHVGPNKSLTFGRGPKMCHGKEAFFGEAKGG